MLNITCQKRAHIKTVMRYHYTPIKMTKIQKTAPNTDKNAEQQEFSFTVGGNGKWYSHFERVWQVLRKLNTVSPYDSGIVLLGIYPITKELTTYVHTKTCKQTFIEALFVIAKN